MAPQVAPSSSAYCWHDHFDRAQTVTTTSNAMGWTKASTGTTPTLAIVNDGLAGGALKAALTSTSEEQICCAYHGDILTFPLAGIIRAKWLARVTGIDAVTTLVMGLASGRNDTEDSVAINAWFRMQGSASLTAIVAESDDGTTDKDDIATGWDLSSTYHSFEIDFTRGLGDVRFLVNGHEVALGTTFNLSAVSATQGMQPLIQIHKASGTGVPAVYVTNLEIEYRKKIVLT